MNSPQENFWKELFKLIILSLVIVIPFRLYIAQPFVVEGASMEPSFETGDYLIVDEPSYQFKAPERGSVLVFKYPKDPSKQFIKRVIGLPGELISIDRGVVTIISSEYPEGLVLEEPYVDLSLAKNTESLSYKLGKDEYFVLGDNRLYSSDSRSWGPVSRDYIVGRPIIRVVPPGLFPGKVVYKIESLNNQKE